MYKIFKNENNQIQFENNGFVQLSLLGINSINSLKNLYDEYIRENKHIINSRYGMHISLNDKDISSKEKLIKSIQSILKNDLDNIFENYKVHLGGFLTKLPDSKSYTYPHQDWTFVDNNDINAFSSTIWISLSNLSISSGSLGFIKGSHKLFDEVIGSPSPVTYTSAQNYSDLFLDYLHVPEVKEGDALIFNNKTIHGAFPNLDSCPRVAIAIGITPEKCDLYHYTLTQNKKRFRKLKVDELFFMKYMNEELYEKYQQNYEFNEYEQAGEVDVRFTSIEKSELENKIIVLENTRNFYETNPIQKEQQAYIEKADSRTFFQKYSFKNIFREVIYRFRILK